MQANNIGRFLVVYDGATEELESLFEIERFELHAFKVQFDITEACDPAMLERYAVGPDDLDFLGRYLDQLPDFDFHKRAYFLEALSKDVDG